MAGGPPVYSSSSRCPRGHDRISIRYFVVKNANARRGGFMPVVATNGRQRGDTYGRGYDRDEALRRARAQAMDEANHYRGDWCITVGKGRPGKLKTKRRRR